MSGLYHKCHPVTEIFGPLASKVFPLCSRNLAKNAWNHSPLSQISCHILYDGKFWELGDTI